MQEWSGFVLFSRRGAHPGGSTWPDSGVRKKRTKFFTCAETVQGFPCAKDWPSVLEKEREREGEIGMTERHTAAKWELERSWA